LPVKKINPFDTAYEQYLRLTKKTLSTVDVEEKNRMFRRRINLLGVMQFLLTEPKLSD
jgi:hypothetical protein